MTKRQTEALRDMATLRRRLKQASVRAAAKPMEYATKEGWRLVEDGELNVIGLKRWMREMVAWGKLVRQDIRRLEECCGLPAGDPGDPPPEPQ